VEGCRQTEDAGAFAMGTDDEQLGDPAALSTGVIQRLLNGRGGVDSAGGIGVIGRRGDIDDRAGRMIRNRCRAHVVTGVGKIMQEKTLFAGKIRLPVLRIEHTAPRCVVTLRRGQGQAHNGKQAYKFRRSVTGARSHDESLYEAQEGLPIHTRTPMAIHCENLANPAHRKRPTVKAAYF